MGENKNKYTKHEWISDVRNNEMKITKTQLKQIIKEEISKVLNENQPSPELKSMHDMLLKISDNFSPETIQRYASQLVDNEVEPANFASGDLEWRDLVEEFDMPEHDAKLIADHMQNLAIDDDPIEGVLDAIKQTLVRSGMPTDEAIARSRRYRDKYFQSANAEEYLQRILTQLQDQLMKKAGLD